ncbi:2TM domain-containing protein [Herbidospora sp. RD11066]
MKTEKSESAKKWGLRVHLLSYVLANVAQVIVWRLYDSDNFFWPMWSIVFWGIGLAFHFWAVYAPPKSNTAQ